MNKDKIIKNTIPSLPPISNTLPTSKRKQILFQLKNMSDLILNHFKNMSNDASFQDADHHNKALFSSINFVKETIAKIDSGATRHYVPSSMKHILSNIKPTHNPHPIRLPNSEILLPTHEGLLPLSPALSPAARTAQIVPHLSTPLLSTGQINYDGCQSHFDENKVMGHKKY